MLADETNSEEPTTLPPDQSERSTDGAEAPRSRFRLGPDSSLDLLAVHLSASFDLIRHPARKETFTIYDTYVWSLWFSDLALVKSDSTLRLHIREDGWLKSPALASIPLKGKCPRFVRNFPPSSLHDQLDDHLGYRALREVGEQRGHISEWDLRNKSAKTVVRLLIRQMGHEDTLATFVEILPLRGYDEEAREASLRLAEISTENFVSGPLDLVLKTQDLEPIPYILKPELKIQPEQDTRSVVCEAALKTLAVARTNEAGILQDWDSEFLHDYRVCLRRIRSVLSAIKGIFPEDKLNAWKETLGKISRHTNQLRDLDVYLLSQDEMTILLPEELRPGLTAFFADLSRERKAEFRRLRTFLLSSGYQELITALEAAFAHPEALEESPHSASPIIGEAAKRIRKRFKRLTKLAEALEKDAPDQDIHSIRIEGKKLRYLLEFFGSLFPEDAINPLASLLSKLQSRLGQFNDTSVQQAYLLKYAKAKGHALEPRLALSLGGLIAALYAEHSILKKEVRQALKKFCIEANADAVSDFISDQE